MSEAGTAVRRPARGAGRRPRRRRTEPRRRTEGLRPSDDAGHRPVLRVPGAWLAGGERSVGTAGCAHLAAARAGRTAGSGQHQHVPRRRLDERQDAAALVRVAEGPAQVLVTVYQAPSAPPETAPRLQVMRLGAEPRRVPGARRQWRRPGGPPAVAPTRPISGACAAYRRRGGQDRRLGRHARQPASGSRASA